MMPKAKMKTKGIPSPHHYFYPGTNTLKNKYGIKDSTVLMEVYVHDVREEIAQLRKEPLPYRTDSSYLCYIHKRLFSRIFEWAGQLRNVPFTFKDGTTAAMPEMIDAEWGTTFAPNDTIHKNLQRLDQILLNKNGLQGLSREEFVEQAAPLFALLYSTRPFRVGNGYTQELFFVNLAEAAGHKLDFSLVKQADINIASIKAAEEGNLGPLRNLFEHISNPENISKKQSRAETQQKGRISPEQQKILKNEGETIFTTSRTGNFSGILIPQKNLPPLSTTEINVIVRVDPSTRESQERIRSLSKFVYGKSKILDKQMKQISTNVKDPSSTGYKLSYQIRKNPKSVGNLAGINFCGLKNAKRRTAEKNVKALTDEIVNLSLTVRRIQREMVKDYQHEQERCAKEVRMPSENLQDLLALPKEMQGQALKESPTLAQELNNFVLALHNRLSPDEARAIKRENYRELATMMCLSEKQAKQIAGVTQKAKAAHLNSQTQTRAIKHSKGLAIAS